MFSMSVRRRGFRAAALVAACAALTACATDGASRDSDAADSAASAAVTPTAILADASPVASQSAVLWVHGMSCPKCVSNVDLQLKRLAGVEAVTINMGLGTVGVTFAGDARPTPQQLARAVDNAGLTLLRIEEAR